MYLLRVFRRGCATFLHRLQKGVCERRVCAEAKVATSHALFAGVVGKHGRPKTVYYICAGGGAGIKEMQQVWCILLQMFCCMLCPPINGIFINMKRHMRTHGRQRHAGRLCLRRSLRGESIFLCGAYRLLPCCRGTPRNSYQICTFVVPDGAGQSATAGAAVTAGAVHHIYISI